MHGLIVVVAAPDVGECACADSRVELATCTLFSMSLFLGVLYCAGSIQAAAGVFLERCVALRTVRCMSHVSQRMCVADILGHRTRCAGYTTERVPVASLKCCSSALCWVYVWRRLHLAWSAAEQSCTVQLRCAAAVPLHV
jgi:hypothetical protein